MEEHLPGVSLSPPSAGTSAGTPCAENEGPAEHDRICFDSRLSQVQKYIHSHCSSFIENSKCSWDGTWKNIYLVVLRPLLPQDLPQELRARKMKDLQNMIGFVSTLVCRKFRRKNLNHCLLEHTSILIRAVHRSSKTPNAVWLLDHGRTFTW
jgi:hypothetical protein